MRLIYPYAHPLLHALISKQFPEKLNFKTIDSVFGAFDSAWTDTTVSSVHFVYDACVWKGTIKRERSQYVGIGLVDFTNIKLPNDGFYYTSEYNNGNGSLIDTKQETTDFVNKVADALLKRTLIHQGDVGEIWADYNEEEERCALYFWSTDKSSCVTVKFENGYHIRAEKQQEQQFKNLLNRLTGK